jgi:hypothetical protein
MGRMAKEKVPFQAHDYVYVHTHARPENGEFVEENVPAHYVDAHEYVPSSNPTLSMHVSFRLIAPVSSTSVCLQKIDLASASANGRGHDGYGSWQKQGEHMMKPCSGFHLI